MVKISGTASFEFYGKYFADQIILDIDSSRMKCQVDSYFPSLVQKFNKDITDIHLTLGNVSFPIELSGLLSWFTATASIGCEFRGLSSDTVGKLDYFIKTACSKNHDL